MSPLPLKNFMCVYARVFPTAEIVSTVLVLLDLKLMNLLFSHSAMTLILSPALPPEDKYETGGVHQLSQPG